MYHSQLDALARVRSQPHLCRTAPQPNNTVSLFYAAGSAAGRPPLSFPEVPMLSLPFEGWTPDVRETRGQPRVNGAPELTNFQVDTVLPSPRWGRPHHLPANYF